MAKFIFMLTAALVAVLWTAQPLWADAAHESPSVEQEETGDHDDHAEESGDHDESRAEIFPAAAAAAGIITAKAASANIDETVSLTGQITINPDRRAFVRARFAGIVRNVNVRLGQAVQKGDVLVVVESSESLKEYPVRAPISGIVLERNTNTGDVAGGDPLFVIVDMRTVWAKFHVFPKDAHRVTEGKTVRVGTIAQSRITDANIDMIFPTVDAPSQTFIAIAALPNDQGLWRPGMTVTGEVVVLQKQVNLAVRRSALQTIENQTVVFVREGNAYEAVPVETGLDDGTYVEIKNGLQAGQEYVSDGSFTVKADILKSGAEHSH